MLDRERSYPSEEFLQNYLLKPRACWPDIPAAWEVEADRSKGQDLSGPQSKFKASLGCV